ncbi:MAG TPA: type II toxin-antitoxin system HicB family antitoxin [Dehalococcoidia bacterium]|nr:type II toxin-antitoxin system HicB family antitoxin [Dehalococcoidia bacterium]
MLVLTKYVDAAMKKAHYELIEDGTYFGEIPGFQGVIGNAPTLEDCREDLRGALEGWLILGLWMNDDSLPKMGKLDLVPRKLAMVQRKNESTASARPRKAS